MPANKKYLTTSSWHIAAKIIAGLIGGYLIASLVHIILILFLPYSKEILITSIFSLFIIWGALMIVPFLFKNGYKVLVLYTAIIILLYVLYYLNNHLNPFA